jgi:serine/threonine-protein kinase RsbW
MNLELHATPEEVMRAVEALQAFGEERQVPTKILFGLTVALEECGANIVNHALQRDASRTFHVSFEQTSNKLIIELRDNGLPFDPTLAPVREPSPDDDDRPPGGWGIQLVRRYTDEQLYTRTPTPAAENVLRLTKRLELPPRQN